LRAIAPSVTSLGESGIATLSVLEPRGNIVKEVLHEVFAIDQASLDKDAILFKVGLTRECLDRLGRAGTVAYEDLSGLSARSKRVVLAQRDQSLDQSLKLLSSSKGGSDVAMANELALKIHQQRASLIARKAKFTSVD
jgi:hypothetical protein